MTTTSNNNVGNAYEIELTRWGIFNDGTNAVQTRAGINNALNWASQNGYNEVILSSGVYLVDVQYERNGTFASGSIQIPSNMVFKMGKDTVVKMQPNTSPWYLIFGFKYTHDITVRGGKVVGDRNEHATELKVFMEPGGVNADGTLNNDPTKIRSTIINRRDNIGLLSFWRAHPSSHIKTSVYSFYQYDNNMKFVNFRTNGDFNSPSGRGWFGTIDEVNKMIIVVSVQAIDPTWSDPTNVNRPYITIDNQYYTHESGHGFGMYASKNICIDNVEVCDMTGDGFDVSYIYKNFDLGEKYSFDEASEHTVIQNCDIYNCRRQGISVTGGNNVHILNNKIHHINGTLPSYGIDLEVMEGTMNIRRAPDPLDPSAPFLRVNEDIFINNNIFYNNARGDITNPDGWNVFITNNHFKSPSLATVSGFGKKMIISNNIFDKGTSLWTESSIEDLIVSNNILVSANFNFRGSKRALISNCIFYGGMLYGTTSSGWVGQPTVNVNSSIFTIKNHDMGNDAEVVVEKGSGTLPPELSETKIYYVVNRTNDTFQLSLMKKGTPITITNAGSGWCVTRSSYSGVTIDGLLFYREKADTTSTAISLLMRGGVIRNVYIQGYGYGINATNELGYTGKPTIVENMTVVNYFMVSLPGAIYSNCNFIKGNAPDRIGEDININNYIGHGKTEFRNCYFDAKSYLPLSIDKCNFLNCHFIGTSLTTSSTNKVLTVLNCLFENSSINTMSSSADSIATIVNNVIKSGNLNLKPTDVNQHNVIIP
ncbi:hypothetical protein CPJCM30710_13900 [Clostridium polyendosporum]|uniref:Right handed beta helix domain-containing protein n=1 Tax=Clostridium polyendosporum TaxID=69208 RepID=A0A919VE40_9CLOT|nr:right-handed parallel beta-helix repeat-containing protein [Clostridium polyendosporum]GIM28724.1 hypothetical protein CPJCM30710_13900 [Clostridium polyendosporum]